MHTPPELDGPTLRNIRESLNLPLRTVAKAAGMSHGHLSKVERGDRPLMPAVVAAYEKAAGIRLSDRAAPVPLQWLGGELSSERLQAFTARVAVLAVGGPLGEDPPKLLDSTGPYHIPTQLHPHDLEHLTATVAMVTDLDLRAGGTITSQLARAALRWTLGMTKAGMDLDARTGLYTAIGQLAHRGGWAAFDAARHHTARSLYTLALDAAIIAADRDLRAHVLADIGISLAHQAAYPEALGMIEIAEGDPRLSPPVRATLYAVKARIYATLGETQLCREYLDRAETSWARTPRDLDGWQATIATAGHIFTTTGHTHAILATSTKTDADRHTAATRLTEAVDLLDPDTDTRALALCHARLATLHLPEDPDTATHHTLAALRHAGRIRSARLDQALNAVRTLATHHHQAAISKFIDEQRRQQPGGQESPVTYRLPTTSTTDPAQAQLAPASEHRDTDSAPTDQDNTAPASM